MKRFIALFRGINVGGNNILPMAELREIFLHLGFSNVKTYIQSGNVVFDSTDDDVNIGAIQQAVLSAKNFQPKVLLLTIDAWQSAIENNLFSVTDGKALHFFFLESPCQNPNITKLDDLRADSEEYRLIGKVFYLFAPDGIGRSKLAAGAEKALGVPVTARNWNTVSKLNSLLEL